MESITEPERGGGWGSSSRRPGRSFRHRLRTQQHRHRLRPGAARDGRSRTFTNANARQARLLCLTAFSNSHRSFTLTNASRMRATASLELLNDTFTCMCSRLALNHLASSCARMHQWRVSLRHSHARVTDPLRITSRNSFSNALKTGHRAPGEGALGNKPKYPRMVQHSPAHRLPQPPPPGVSIRKTSPASRCKLHFPASSIGSPLTLITVARPAEPSSPPCKPQGRNFLRSASSVT